MLVQKMIIQAAVKLLSKQFKLDKILKYVEEPNELDDEVARLRSRIELLEAITPDSPVARFIEKKGEGVHHLAFEVDGIDQALEALRKDGYQLIDETPRTGAGGTRVAFVHPRSTKGVLIELCEKNQ